MQTFKGQGTPLDRAGMDSVLEMLGIDEASMWTVLAVETSGVGFLADKRPKILFERHIFSRQTGGKYDQQNPDISNPQPGGYGASGANQYDRLAEAIALDETAALMSASWGVGQIMGFNFKAAGFGNVGDMVSAMVDSEGAQLMAMANFLVGDGLDGALKSRNWQAYAKVYNGPNYAINKYDTRLAAAYAQYTAGALPDLDARAAQLFLIYLGYNPGPVDGMPGKMTFSALSSFLQDKGQPPSNSISADILDLLRQSAAAV